MDPVRRVVVVGTGTDVGKTHVVCAMLACLKAKGLRARGYKPIASGVDPLCDDALRHAEAIGASPLVPTFAYRRPISPHLAAREEGVPIDIPLVVRVADEMEKQADVVLVEGAGGLFSPLSDTLTNADLARALHPDAVILVAADRLGVLHDVHVTRLAAQACGLGIDAVVLSSPEVADASTGTNGAELARLGLGPVAAVFPRSSPVGPESRRAAAMAWAVLNRQGPPSLR